VVFLASGCALLAAPRPPTGSESAARLQAGPYRVASADVVFEDQVRGRTLASTLWWPAESIGPAPLVVQAHGFLADRSGGTYVAKHLASHGYVVVAATHPTTTFFAPGGARLEDVIRQPGDVSFLIDRLLASGGQAIDPARIAVMGHSLGGLTATLAAFHPRLRDARIAAAISIAGPMEMFQPRFFATADVPFLMIAGSGDVIVDYRKNAFVTLDRVPGGTLVVIAGASHSGFDDAMTGLPRLMDNPDKLGCWVLDRTLHLDTALAKLREHAQDGDGIDLEGGVGSPCLEEPPRVAMDPARQQMITTLAATAFLESRFAPDTSERTRARHYLTEVLPRDFEEVSVSTAAGGE
jgi:predicted dienelactone hydrolase